ncbi:unnamed protein product [Moneuplotes crassus]|uniref:Uncharacterized protein n=1 Tax=Euplotes crassus TaxID=5936 RepID=A0AAD1UE34_EUPCR|nr:unnamed protein product [Moneuplotes crassus]
MENGSTQSGGVQKRLEKIRSELNLISYTGLTRNQVIEKKTLPVAKTNRNLSSENYRYSNRGQTYDAFNNSSESSILNSSHLENYAQNPVRKQSYSRPTFFNTHTAAHICLEEAPKKYPQEGHFSKRAFKVDTTSSENIMLPNYMSDTSRSETRTHMTHNSIRKPYYDERINNETLHESALYYKMKDTHRSQYSRDIIQSIKQEISQRYENEIESLKRRLSEYEHQTIELEMITSKYNRTLEENKLMQDTIKFLINQNEQNIKSSDEHMNLLNQRIDAILSNKPITPNLPQDDPVVTEIIFQKLNSKIQDLESEIDRLKSLPPPSSSHLNFPKSSSHTSQTLTARELKNSSNIKIAHKPKAHSKSRVKKKRDTTLGKENQSHNTKKTSGRLALKKFTKNSHNRGILKQRNLNLATKKGVCKGSVNDKKVL